MPHNSTTPGAVPAPTAATDVNATAVPAPTAATDVNATAVPAPTATNSTTPGAVPAPTATSATNAATVPAPTAATDVNATPVPVVDAVNTGLPTVESARIDYDDLQTTVDVSAAGQYKFTLGGVQSETGRNSWNEINSGTVTNLWLHRDSTGGGDESANLSNIKVGDRITVYYSSGKWVKKEVAFIHPVASNVYGFSILSTGDNDESDNTDAIGTGPGVAVQFRIEKPHFTPVAVQSVPVPS